MSMTRPVGAPCTRSKAAVGEAEPIAAPLNPSQVSPTPDIRQSSPSARAHNQDSPGTQTGPARLPDAGLASA